MKNNAIQKVVTGFIILMLTYGVIGYISFNNVNSSQKITDKNSNVYQPSLVLLNEFNLLIVNARNYTNTWITIDISNHDDKIRLRDIHKIQYPEFKKELATLLKLWEGTTQYDSINSIIKKFEIVLKQQKEVMSSLNSIENYKDFYLRVEMDDLTEQISIHTDNILLNLQVLIVSLKKITKEEEDKINTSFLSIRTSNIILNIIGIIIGIIVATVTLKSVKLQAQKIAISAERDEIQIQKSIIEEKNREILSSINYAKRIQHSILPSNDEIKKYFGNAFIFYRPRDIVSGDFYWFRPLGDELLIAAADCTGHGVPGAFVSFVCYNSLNACVDEMGLTNPAQILDNARELLVKAFGQHSEDGVNDGMDICLCKINTKTMELEYAGANNPLWFTENIENENNEGKMILPGIREIKADKQPVGLFENKKPYTNHKIKLKKGQLFYSFTDGFADQFGGEKNKKYNYKRFATYLESIKAHPIEQQFNLLQKEFNSWKGNNDQTDDVLIIAIQV